MGVAFYILPFVFRHKHTDTRRDLSLVLVGIVLVAGLLVSPIVLYKREGLEAIVPVAMKLYCCWLLLGDFSCCSKSGRTSTDGREGLTCCCRLIQEPSPPPQQPKKDGQKA